jgi:putative transposase
VHRIANVLDKPPKRLQPKAKAALHDIMKAESREAAEAEADTFREEYGVKYPKTVGTLDRDQEKLFTFFDFPAEHWVHIRTSNPIESAVRAFSWKARQSGRPDLNRRLLRPKRSALPD